MTWIVHVGGLGWSGSSAVLDALLDTDRFRSLKGKTAAVNESRLFSGRPTLPSVAAGIAMLQGDDVLALWTAGTRVPDGATLAAPVRRLLSRSAGEHQINRKVLRTIDDEPLREAADATASLVRAAMGEDERAIAYLQGTYAALRSLLGGDGRHLLIDNDPGVTAKIDQHLLADDQTIFVAVIRGPSDQYVDRRAQIEAHEPVALNALRMIRSARLRRHELEALTELAERRPERLLVVSFEDFVTNAKYRERFFERLFGTSTISGNSSPRFQPEHSVRNIGLAVRPKDRLPHEVFRRGCEGQHARAAAHAASSSWPGPAIDMTTGPQREA